MDLGILQILYILHQPHGCMVSFYGSKNVTKTATLCKKNMHEIYIHSTSLSKLCTLLAGLQGGQLQALSASSPDSWIAALDFRLSRGVGNQNRGGERTQNNHCIHHTPTSGGVCVCVCYILTLLVGPRPCVQSFTETFTVSSCHTALPTVTHRLVLLFIHNEKPSELTCSQFLNSYYSYECEGLGLLLLM